MQRHYALFVVGLSLLTFMLPAESSEKITLGITVFLSYSFLIVIVTDSTPQTGALPQLGIYSKVSRKYLQT